MRTAIVQPHPRQGLGASPWARFDRRAIPAHGSPPSPESRPLLAAGLVAAAGAVLVGGCLVAACFGGVVGFAAALLGFAGYLVAFRRGLAYLPVEWNSLRAKNYPEFHEDGDEATGWTERWRS